MEKHPLNICNPYDYLFVTVHTPPTSQPDIRGFGHFARGGVNYYVSTIQVA